MKNKLSIVLGTSLSLALLGCLAGAPKTKTVKAEGQNLKTDTLNIMSFRAGSVSSIDTGYYQYLADGANSYARYGATASVSGSSFGLKAGPTETPYPFNECFSFSVVQSYGSLTSMTLNFAQPNSIPEGAELVCFCSNSETQFMYADNVYYGRNSYDKLFTLDSTFTEGAYTFDVPKETTVKSFSFIVTGTATPIYFNSLAFTWDVEPNRIVQDLKTWSLDVGDGPQDPPVHLTSDFDPIYTISEGDYVLEYNTETEKFVPLGYGHASVKVEYGTEYLNFDVFVTEDAEGIIIHSNDTADVATEGWDEVTDPSTLTYGDVVTIYSKETMSAVGSYINDEECGKFGLSVNYDFIDIDDKTVRFYDDDFMKFMLVPSGSTDGGFGLLSLSGSKDQFLRAAYWEDMYSYNTVYSVLLGEPTVVPSALSSVFARNPAWTFNATRTSSDDNVLMIDSTMGNGLHLGVIDDMYVDFVSDNDHGVTLLKYVGELNETYEFSDKKNGSSQAITFAHFFMDKMTEVCLTGADNVKTRFAKFFTTINGMDPYSKFNWLGSDSLFVLKNAEANENGDILQQFASLYDFIVTEYEVTDYVGRNPTSTTGSNSLTVGMNSSIAAIVAIASVGALISLLYVAFRSSKKVTD